MRAEPALRLDRQVASSCADLPTRAELKRWAAAALAGRRERAELTVRLVDEAESQALNSAYRGKEQPTNVLSFVFEAPPGVESDLLGDLVICAPVVRREADEQGKAVQAHWAHLLVHGVLHLLGYDHQEEAEAEAMEALEVAILAELEIPNPYAAG